MNAILLAAGQSKRMGCQKLLLPFGGRTVIETVIDNLLGAGIERIFAVISREVELALPPLPDGVETRVNKAPERGQSSSLAIGLDMLGEGRDFCIMLADLPLADSVSIAALGRRFAAMPPEKTLLAPWRDGRFGHPMFYRALWRGRFRLARGDGGGRETVARYDAEIERIEAPGCHFKDIDTPDDYAERVRQMECGANEIAHKILH